MLSRVNGTLQVYHCLVSLSTHFIQISTICCVGLILTQLPVSRDSFNRLPKSCSLSTPFLKKNILGWLVIFYLHIKLTFLNFL